MWVAWSVVRQVNTIRNNNYKGALLAMPVRLIIATEDPENYEIY